MLYLSQQPLGLLANANAQATRRFFDSVQMWQCWQRDPTRPTNVVPDSRWKDEGRLDDDNVPKMKTLRASGPISVQFETGEEGGDG